MAAAAVLCAEGSLVAKPGEKESQSECGRCGRGIRPWSQVQSKFSTLEEVCKKKVKCSGSADDIRDILEDPYHM